MVDVEILQDMKVEFSEPIIFKKFKQQVATMIINGQVQNAQEIEFIAVVCPKCGKTLQQFNPDVTLEEVYKTFGEVLEIKKDAYCPHCRVKLSYDKRFVSTQQGVFVE